MLEPITYRIILRFHKDGQNFAEIATISDSGSCTAAIGCILHDKTVTAEASESDCTSKQRCDAVCWTGNTAIACADEDECTNSGECVGDEFLEPYVPT